MKTLAALGRSRRILGDRLMNRHEVEAVSRRPLHWSVDRRRLRPEFMSDLWEGLAIEIREIVETAINRRHLIFCQVQGHPLFPKLIESKIIT